MLRTPTDSKLLSLIGGYTNFLDGTQSFEYSEVPALEIYGFSLLSLVSLLFNQSTEYKTISLMLIIIPILTRHCRFFRC